MHQAPRHDEAAAMLGADPAITEGVMTGVVRRWHAVFNETEDLLAAQGKAREQACRRGSVRGGGPP